MLRFEKPIGGECGQRSCEMRRSFRPLPRPSPTAGWWSAPRPWAIASCSIRCAGWSTAAACFGKHLASEPAALLFGSEKFGLSNDDLSYCHWLMRIGTREEHGSMNLGQAVAVCLYELRRKVVRRKIEQRLPAKSEDVERITTSLLEILERSGYVHSVSTDAKIRRLMRRMQLQAHDAEVWLGILRQIGWKLDILRTSDKGSA